jgi:hypothetical protein
LAGRVVADARHLDEDLRPLTRLTPNDGVLQRLARLNPALVDLGGADFSNLHLGRFFSFYLWAKHETKTIGKNSSDNNGQDSWI